MDPGRDATPLPITPQEQSEIEELRRLLLPTERARLERVEQRLEDRAVTADDVGAVIADAIAASGASDPDAPRLRAAGSGVARHAPLGARRPPERRRRALPGHGSGDPQGDRRDRARHAGVDQPRHRGQPLGAGTRAGASRRGAAASRSPRSSSSTAWSIASSSSCSSTRRRASCCATWWRPTPRRRTPTWSPGCSPRSATSCATPSAASPETRSTCSRSASSRCWWRTRRARCSPPSCAVTRRPSCASSWSGRWRRSKARFGTALDSLRRRLPRRSTGPRTRSRPACVRATTRSTRAAAARCGWSGSPPRSSPRS